MDFWPAYYKESLGEPWLIQPEGLAPSLSQAAEPLQAVVFISKMNQDPQLISMMEKMAQAIKLSLHEVSFEFFQEDSLASLAGWVTPKKIMVFGKDFSPEHFSQNFQIGNHQIILTHSLHDLHNQPELKKETWEHLKKFARLR